MIRFDPSIQVLIGMAFSILYGIGNYGRSKYKDIFKIVGMAVIGLVILNIFFTQCAGTAVGYIFQLAAGTIILQVFVWGYFKIFGKDDKDNLKESYHPSGE